MDRDNEEKDEDLIDRGKMEIDRELLRISVAEGLFFKSTLQKTIPTLSNNIIVRAHTGWFHSPLKKEDAKPQNNWSPNIETKLVLWEKVQNESQNPRLIYAYLNMICELSLDKAEKDWNPHETDNPTAYQEIKIIRNLLLHANNPKGSVKEYLVLNKIAINRNVLNSQDHCFHARSRLHALLPEVRKLLLKDLGF